jgi:hypothetical protein
LQLQNQINFADAWGRKPNLRADDHINSNSPSKVGLADESWDKMADTRKILNF